MNNISFEELTTVAIDIDDDMFGPRSKEFFLTRLIDEARELIDATIDSDNNPTPGNKFEELKEFGDILYCLVACSNQHGWNMSEALSLTITKIQERKKFSIINEKE